jgi:GMP synthase-like glutamine amidotransferase
MLQHVPFEGPAAIGHWAVQRGAPLTLTRLFAREPLPPLEDIDLLVVLGGPMSVNDEAQFDWLVREKRYVRNAIASGKRILGVCLGAQLIASALGARVYANAEREIGWWPVSRTPEAATHPLAGHWPDQFTPLHWHSETFDLPAGAVGLAQSRACLHQAFAAGDRVLGLQFHLESTPESVQALAQYCPGDLAPGTYVQTAKAMLARLDRFQESNRLMTTLLETIVNLPG